MAHKDDCIFCKIAQKQIETTVVAENEHALAFNDASPQAPVHVLVVPKEHHDNLIDGVSAQTLKAMTDVVAEVAQKTGVTESGFRVLANTGKDAGQTVMHLHWHILGGVSMGEGLL